MAVEAPQTNQVPQEAELPKQSTIGEYWPRYRRFALLFTIVMQVLLTAVVGFSLSISGVDPSALVFWIVLIATLVGSLGVNLILINQVLLPLKDLTSALTHASGEPTDVVPPNPNASHNERDGFKPLLQFIYERSANQDSPEKKTDDDQSGLLAKALEQTSAGIAILDAAGSIAFSNSKAPITVDNTNQKHLQLLFEDSNTLEQWLQQCRESAVHAEKTWLRVPNTIVGQENRKIYDISASYEKESAAEVVVMLFDRTEVYQPEDDSLDFIAFAAHELRGPITVIRGYLDVLDIEVGPSLDAEQRELIKRLTVSANRLSGYINNILNASKFDRRHLKIHLVEESLSGIYDTVNDDLQLRAQSQNRLLSVSIPDNLPTVAADRSSLSEVIANLVDNALKYSNEGGVVNVTAAVDGNYVKIAVVDNGIGMPANVVSNLFQKFYRSHRSRETVSGTGIGLYISKAVVESHGGTIGVISAEGQGSTFSFTVPIYSSVKDKLVENGSTNEGMISEGAGWIKNHSMYKG